MAIYESFNNIRLIQMMQIFIDCLLAMTNNFWYKFKRVSSIYIHMSTIALDQLKACNTRRKLSVFFFIKYRWNGNFPWIWIHFKTIVCPICRASIGRKCRFLFEFYRVSKQQRFWPWTPLDQYQFNKLNLLAQQH